MESSKNLSDFLSSGQQNGSPGSSQQGAKPGLSSLLDNSPKREPGKRLDPAEVDAIATREGLTPTQKKFLNNLLEQETGYGANARTSTDGARGPGQVMPGTFRQYARPGEAIDDPAHNLAVMSRIVKDLGTRFGDDPAKIATGYFSGPGNVNPGQGNAWKEDRADGNGKRVSSYVGDVLSRMGILGTANAAEAPKGQGLPDLSQVPKWGEIAASKKFAALDDNAKRELKGRYFDENLAPHAKAAGADVGKEREAFMAEQPGLLDRALGGLKSAAQAVGDAFTSKPDLLSQVKPSPSNKTTPVDPQVRAAFNAQWDAATPQEREAMGKRSGWVGALAREHAADFPQEQAQPQTQAGQALQSFVQGDQPVVDASLPTVADKLDPRAEKRAARLVAAGEDPRFAQTAARAGARAGVAPGQELKAVGSTVQASNFDFDTAQAFDMRGEANGMNNAVVRGLAKAGAGTSKAFTGMGEFFADVYGLDQAKGMLAKGSNWARGKEDAIGEQGSYMARNFEGVVNSIAQQLPLLLTGTKLESEAIPLAGMAVQTFGQEYSDGRAQGQSTGQAAVRAGIFAAFEVIGEKFGLHSNMEAIKAAAKGLPSDKIVGFLWDALKKEVPGELLTTTGQFATDKFAPGGVGLTPNATGEDYLRAMADTFVQTLMQSGTMAGGTTGAAAAVRFARERGPSDGVMTAEANAAREQALAAWQQRGPAAGVTPTAPAAAAPHPMVQSADEIVRELAQQAGVPEDVVLPVQRAEAPPVVTTDGGVTDQDVMDFAASRAEQLMAKRDGTVETVMSEAGPVDQEMPGKGLSPSEEHELGALQRAGDNVAALRGLYGFNQPEIPNEAQQVQDEQGQGQEPGPALGQDAGVSPAPEQGPAPEQEPAADPAGAQDGVAGGQRDAGQQVPGEPAQVSEPASFDIKAATDEQLRQRRDEIVEQAKRNGGWDAMTREARHTIEAELERRTPAPAPAPAPAAPNAPKTEKEAKQRKAIERIAKGTAYFGKETKAKAWIAENGLSDTHTAVRHSSGANRWDVVAKEAPAGEQGQAAAPAPAAAQAPQEAADPRGAGQAGAGEQGSGVSRAGDAGGVQAAGVSEDTPAARWTRMATADRAALALRIGIKPPYAGNMAERAWDRIDPVLHERLAKAMERPQVAPKNDAPGTRYRTDADLKAADRLANVADQINADRNSRAGNARATIKSVADELRKPKTVISVESMLDTAAEHLDRTHSAQADVVREVVSQIDQRNKQQAPKVGTTEEGAGGSQPTPAGTTDLNAMFDEVLAEEVAKDAKAKPEPKTEKEAKAQLLDELRSKLGALADRAFDAGDGAMSGRIRAFTQGMKTTDSNLSRAWVDEVVTDFTKRVERLEKKAAPKTEKQAKAQREASQPEQGTIGMKLAAGQVVLTASGRQTTPFPKVNTETARKTGDTLYHVNRWLITNAHAEAVARGDDFNARQFESVNLAKRDIPQADKDSAEEYLFGQQPAVVPSILKPLGSAGKNTAAALGNAIDGLGALFGGTPGKLNSGIGFDEDTYAKAKPLFQAAIANLGDAGSDLKEAMRQIVRMVLDKFGAQVAQNMKPYVVRFVSDIQSVTIDTQQESTTNAERGANQAPGEPASQQRGTDQPGSGQADQEGLADSSPANGATAGQPGADGRPGADSASQDVGSRGPVRKSRNATDGRKGTSGAGVADDGAREGAAGNPAADPVSGTNYHIADPEQLIGGTPKVRFARNKKGIEAFNAITSEGREPTKDELDAMAGYIGWGSFGQELFQGTYDRPAPKAGWEKESDWLREHLGKEGWQSAQDSIINAHYTDPVTVAAMWGMVRQLGFTGGRILEPSMGVGNFFGLMPRDLMERSKLAGIEMETTTGGMAKLLYPEANIQIKPYQDSKTADDFYDLVIGNWPFAKDGPVDRRYLKLSPSLHDYFFLKALDQTRPGGLVVGITSAGTMDKVGTLTRAALAEKADLVAAFRLPSGAFEKYAGTKVVTDIIILKKRDTPNKNVRESGWLEVKEVPTPSGTPVRVNQYFAAHPDHILGTLDYGHGTTSMRPGMIVNRPADLEARLNALAKTLPTGVFTPQTTKAKTIQYVTNNTKDREQSLVEKDGALYQVHGEYLAPLSDVVNYKVKDEKKTAARVDQIKRLVAMRRAYGALIDAERDGLDDTQAKRAALKKAYDSFVADHGTVNDSDGLAILKRVGDPFYPTLAALEDKGKPSAIMTRQTVRAKRRLDKPSVRDALVMVRNESIDLNMDRVAELAGVPVEKAAKELGEAGAIYMTPAGNYEVGDVYLSGNVRRKLREAEAAAEQGMDMKANIEALRAVQPKDIPYYNIEAKLGATWIRPEQYREFIARLLGVPASDDIEVRWSVNRWKVKFNEPTLNRRPEATTTWGHPAIRFDRLISAAMGNVSVRITYKDSDGNTVVDEAQTAEANEKAGKVREEFSTWLWSDPARRIEMERTYNESMNAIALPKFDGSFLSFEGMALLRGDKPFNLREHQVNAIWRGLANGRSINAHEVGTGKTYTMGGLAIESRRYGIAKKPIIFAHNANSASVAREIGEMYPGAKLLYIDNLAPDRIAVTLRQIANDDWDAIVVPHSLIDRFTLKRETLMEISREEIDALEMEAIEAAQEDGSNLTVADMDDEKAMKKVRSSTAKQLVHARNAIKKKIEEQAAKSSREDSVSFEDMGIDMVIVDEAHEFKKPPIATRMRMKGLNTATSSQSISMNFLTSYVKKINGGRGVHLFTGTPITNTMTEIFNVMRYVMDDQMARDGLQDWDAWFNTFADSTNDVELTASGEYEPVTRLAAFVNTAELRRMIGQYMDIVFADDMPEFKPRPTSTGKTLSDNLTDAERDELLNGRNESPVGRPYKRVVTDTAEMTADQKEILATLQSRANAFKRATKKDRKEMMMSGSPNSPVIVETDASNAGLDARLFDITAKDEPASKVNRAVTRLVHHYNEHPLATQVVFVERGFTSESVSRKRDKETGQVTVTKKARFNLIEDLIDKLVAQGVKREQIAVVDGSTSKEKRKLIADAMNRAEIRVVIGNTKTLGVGVNMQTNLRAMHHLDAPWMPGDLEQRNGRGHRQGNKWNTVLEYRYLTERIDGRRWQVLSVKDRFIKAFLKVDEAVRVIDGDAVSMDDEGDLGSTLADAAGDPRLLMMNKLRADVAKLEGKERMHSQAIYDAGQMAKQLERDIKDEGVQADRAERDNEFFREKVKAGTHLEINGKVITDTEEANEALARAVQTKVTEPSRDSVELGTIWGFTIEAYWPTKFSDVQYTVSRTGGLEYAIGKATVESARATLYGIKERIAKYEARIAEKTTSLPRMVEATKAPFARAEELAKKRKMFSDIEADIQLNPIPAPAWLRNGAPVNTAVFLAGKPAVVEGHRWTKDGYMVTLTQGDTTKDVDYLEVKDANGLPIYEVHPFTSPEVTSADGTKTAQGATAPKPGDVKFAITDDQDGYTAGHEEAQVHTQQRTERAARNMRRFQAGVLDDLSRLGRDFANDVAYYIPVDVPQAREISEIARTFGTEVQWFDLKEGLTTEQRRAFGRYAGANIGGVQYLNASTNDRPHLAILGHELAHQMRKDNPALYDEFVDAVNAYIKPGAYKEFLTKPVAVKATDPREEFSGEVLSDLFMERDFWISLGERSPTLLGRVAEMVTRLVEQIMHAVGYTKRSAPYLTDFRKVMEIAADVMTRYAGQKMKAAGEGDADIRFMVQEQDEDPAQQGLVRRVQNNLLQFFGNRQDSIKTFGTYDRTLATQYHKALKDAQYGKVFALANAMQNHVSLSSVRPAELAPGLLPRVDDIRSAARTLARGAASAKPIEAAAKAIFAGTLAGNNVMGGKVWTDDQLRTRFGLNDAGVAMYRQSRAAIDASLDEMAAAEAYALVQGMFPRTIRRVLIDHPQAAEGMLTTELEKQIRMLGIAIKAAKKAGDEVRTSELEATQAAMKGTARKIEVIFTTAKNLKKAGYAPLMRFGKFEVKVTHMDPVTGSAMRDADGEVMTEFMGRYETEAEARLVYRRMLDEFGDSQDIEVRLGDVSQTAHELYAGISPETIALFADALGAEPVMRKYIEDALSERSALKRRLERKGTAGYSQDLPRVLSTFITSNGRHAAKLYYLPEMNQAIKRIPRNVKGTVLDEALALKKFILDPNDPAAPVSSVMFAWFLGGSIASAVVNLSQPFMMTAPYLSQHGAVVATKAMAKALPYAMGRKEITDGALRQALKRASQEGIVDAQEIFHLYSVGAQGVATRLASTLSRLPVVGKGLKAGSEDFRARANAFLTLWGSMFSVAEGFNRKLTFIAAWDVAKVKGMQDPYAFAVRAVNETQGVYNKVNRPNLARGPVGRTIMTFKQFSIMYVELLTRMWKRGGPEGKRAAKVMLLVLWLAAGESGLPFADDLDDLIDTIGQGLFGWDTNAKRIKRRWAYEMLGKELGDFFLYGASAHLPLDFSNRLGLGNLIPGTGLLKKSDESQRGRNVAEMLGPTAGMATQIGDAYDAIVEGNPGKALQNMAPKAIKDVLAATEMATKGRATDARGRKVVDTDATDVAVKAIGFTPTKVAQETRKTMPVQQDIALQKRTKESILSAWQEAISDGDKAAIAEARQRLDDWNRRNPETPIVVKPAQLKAGVRQLNTDKDRRVLKQAPKEMRGRIGLELMDDQE